MLPGQQRRQGCVLPLGLGLGCITHPAPCGNPGQHRKSQTSPGQLNALYMQISHTQLEASETAFLKSQRAASLCKWRAAIQPLLDKLLIRQQQGQRMGVCQQRAAMPRHCIHDLGIPCSRASRKERCV